MKIKDTPYAFSEEKNLKVFGDTENDVKTINLWNKRVWGTHGVSTWFKKISGYEEVAMVFTSLVGYSHQKKFLRVGFISFPM